MRSRIQSRPKAVGHGEEQTAPPRRRRRRATPRRRRSRARRSRRRTRRRARRGRTGLLRRAGVPPRPRSWRRRIRPRARARAGDHRRTPGRKPVDGRPELERLRAWRTSHARRVRRAGGRRGTSRPAPPPEPRRSRASIAAQVSAASNTSRAMTWARASTGSDSPVSSHRRDRKLMPARFTTALATTVATISRRSGCDAERVVEAGAQRQAGSTSTRSASRYGSSGTSDATSARCSSSLV